MVDNLEVFLHEAIGQKYELTPNKLLRNQTVGKVDRKMIDTNRTFFCSELVAKAYKVLGIIQDDETACSQFYPHHFSAQGDAFLRFTPGTNME